jgi:hypothetical protein
MEGLWYSIFCSQKINLLVFLIGIADYARPLVMHSTEWWKEWKKAKSHTQAQNKSHRKTKDHVWFEDQWMVASLCDEWLRTLCGLILG